MDEDGVRRTISEMLELLERRQRSFPACGITSTQVLPRAQVRRRTRGVFPDDPFGDVYLVVDNFAALTAEASTIRNKDLLSAQIQKTRRRGQQLRHPRHHRRGARYQPAAAYARLMASPRRTEAARPRGRQAAARKLTDAVPSGKPGRGMVAQNYSRLGSEEEGLHTLIARPALRGTPATVFDSASVVEAVRRVAANTARRRGSAQLPTEVTLAELQARAHREQHPGMAWALERARRAGRYGQGIAVPGGHRSRGLRADQRPGRDHARNQAGLRAGAHSGTARATDDDRPRAQVWLVDPRRELLKVLGKDYLERFIYRNNEVGPWAAELNRILTARLARGRPRCRGSLARRWSGPEIFLIVDDGDRLPVRL